MSYAISVPVGGYFSAHIRAEVAIRTTLRNAKTFLSSAMTPRPDVFMAFERFDAEITARDNRNIEIAKLVALLAFDPSV